MAAYRQIYGFSEAHPGPQQSLLRTRMSFGTLCLFGVWDYLPRSVKTLAAAVVLAPVPLPRRRRHEKHAVNGVSQLYFSPVPDSNQRSVNLFQVLFFEAFQHTHTYVFIILRYSFY